MSQKYEKLKGLLRELFQLNQPDLDFGLYRIMHAKSAEVTQFLDKDLLPQVKEAFSLYKTADKAELEKGLAKAIEQAQALGADPETLPKVKEFRAKLANDAVDVDGLENEVYDHLYSFFRRYYSEGDFLAKRVYKPGVYAIPYEGEEVTLHWANQDQYYIKTSEYLRDYAFCLRPDDDDPMRVHFRLAEAAEGEHGNIKTTEDQDRHFILATQVDSPDDFVRVEKEGNTAELIIEFQYRPAALADWPEDQRAGKPKPPSQKELLLIAANRILRRTEPSLVPWVSALSKNHTAANGEVVTYSRLEAHLRRYAARNTFDYFIHKELSVFLQRELDFYIKNEVMHLDDIENDNALRVEQYLSKVRVIRSIAKKIIAFLGQLEDFQKRLWRKQKFVVETNYCVSLDRIPEALYPQIAGNDAQREEWVRFFAIDEIEGDLVTPKYSVPLTTQFLKAHPHLTIDTRHFDTPWVEALVSSLSESDQGLRFDGLCIMGENFHALSLLQRTYRKQLTSIYIDPPYNTDATPIAYKNGYRHSSWLSLIENRLDLSMPLLADSGILCVTIDDVEVHALRSLIAAAFPQYEVFGVAPIKNNPAGRTGTVGFSVCHEYAIFYGLPTSARIGRLEHSASQKARYKESDEISAFEWTNFRKHGGLNTYRSKRPRQFYPIYVAGDRIRIPEMEWDDAARDWKILEGPEAGEEVLLPIDEKGRERIWDFVATTAKTNIPHFKVKKDAQNQTAIYRKWRLNDEGLLPQTWWDKSEYSAAEYGTNLLTNMFGETHRFTFPKSLHAVVDCLKVSGLRNDADGMVLDYFGGSGTTAHAVIALNRMDGGTRRYVLVDMAEYFDTALMPRIRKAAYAAEWRDGKPKSHSTGTSHTMKYLRIESYEDALNNLDVRRTSQQQLLLNADQAQGAGKLKENYMLRYMLGVETRASQSLLNVQAFIDPTAYKLRIKKPGSEETQEVNVDLIETFNWLLGLEVHSQSVPQRFDAAFGRDQENRLQLDGKLKPQANGPWWFRIVEGNLPDGRKTLLVWRKLTGNLERDNLVLDVWMEDRLKISTKDFEFDLIYVNGDNNLKNLKLPDDTWKVRLIEDDFHNLMFDGEGL
jgi:adenine-specific DNA-methyltransferase